jgi:hypothetical protein
MKWCFYSHGDAVKHERVLSGVNPGEVVDIDGIFYMVTAKEYDQFREDHINCVKIYTGELIPFNQNILVDVYPSAKLKIK